jgi:peptidoglycan hydrolase CwlO-like protein
VDGAALGAQLAALSAAVKEIADQQSKDREAAKALEAERAAAVAAAAKQAEEQAKQAEVERAARGEELRGESGRDRAARVDGAGGSERAGGGTSGLPGAER